MNYITKENNVFESYTNTNLIRSFSNNEWSVKWSGTQIEIARMDDNKIISREWVNINHNEETNTFKFDFLRPYNIPSCIVELCEEIAKDVLLYYKSLEGEI